jgi:uncharacterized protein YjbI with pentapeptide repeats
MQKRSLVAVLGVLSLLLAIPSAAAAASHKTSSAPVITVQPVDSSAKVGHNARFSVKVSGWPKPSIQWQVSTDGGATFASLGAPTKTLVTPAESASDGNQYHAVVSNSAGTAISNAVVLTLLFHNSKFCSDDVQQGGDLQDCDLSGINLARANLSGANLSNALLTGTDLQGADLDHTTLSDANLSDANLSGATLRSANVQGVNLNTSLTGAITFNLAGPPAVLPTGFAIEGGALVGPGDPSFFAGVPAAVEETIICGFGSCPIFGYEELSFSGTFTSAQTGPGTFSTTSMGSNDGGCPDQSIGISIADQVGDTLDGEVVGPWCWNFDLLFTITGGTGIFAGDTGSIPLGAESQSGIIGALLTP